jgi:hypothetical protein
VILRIIAAALGVLLVGSAGASVVSTIVVPGAFRSRLTSAADRLVNGVFRGLERIIRDDGRRATVLAFRAACLLLAQLALWLASCLLGFALLLLPVTGHSLGYTLSEAGSAMTTIGFAETQDAAEKAIAVLAAFASLATLALQLGYLPALYGAYNRRETAVALLNARAGVPTWGPELLARTHYGLGTGKSSLGTMPDLYAEWERWAADVAESHRTYLPLVYFRSHRPLSSWVTALLGVLDSAALHLALSPSTAPTIAARLCLRSGFLCFTRIAQALGVPVPDEADPAAGISLSYAEFEDAVSRLRRVDFPVERPAEEAWPHFVGWRVNYERAAYAVARAVSAPPALWSGPRRSGTTPVPPLRPPDNRPDAGNRPRSAGAARRSADADGGAPQGRDGEEPPGRDPG